MQDLLPPSKADRARHIAKAFRLFLEMYEVMHAVRPLVYELNSHSKPAPTAEQIAGYRTTAALFVQLFHDSETKAVGTNLGLKDFTPYLHLICHHVPVMLETFGSVNLFSCEHLERVNKIQRRFCRHHSNHFGE